MERRREKKGMKREREREGMEGKGRLYPSVEEGGRGEGK